MTMPMEPNITFDVFRTYTAATPYTTGAAGKANAKGYLKPAVQTGRHGSATWLKWTHMLYCNSDIEIRDAYDSQLDPARDNTIADTIMLKDTTDGTIKTAFFVVFVELINRKTQYEHLRVYLDRAQPNAWPTNAL